MLNGLMTPGGLAPPDYGASAVARLWGSQCHVDAYTLFE